MIEDFFRHLNYVGDRPPASALVIVQNGKISIDVRGFSDIENGVEASAKSRFHVASLAKQFTALLIARFIDRGAISMDTPIGDLIPWLLSPVRDCRIRHLLFHTSGARDQWALGYFAGIRSGDEILTRDVVAWLSHEKTLNFASGSKFLYCNTGYTLLALALEHLAKKPFNVLAEEEIFTPLGMNDTLFVSDPRSQIDRRVRGYTIETGLLRTSDPNYGVIGSSCLRTSPSDMAKWLSVDLAGAVFRTGHDIGVLEPGYLDDRSPIRYGFGLIHGEIAGAPVIMHGGYDFGFNAAFIRAKSGELSIFACGSGGFATLEQSAINVFAACKRGESPSPTGVGVGADKPSGTTALKPGVYANADFSDVRAVINLLGGAQRLEWMQGFYLAPIEGTAECSVVGTPITVNQAGDELIFENGTDSLRLALQKAEPFDAGCFVGRYYCSSLGSTATIMPFASDLMIRIGRSEPAPLTIVNQNLIRWQSYWAVLTSDGGTMRLEMSHPRCLQVVFEKVD